MKFMSYKIVQLQSHKVAEFTLEFPFRFFNFIDNQWEWVSTWRLDKENLEIRIANGKKYGFNTDLEREALAELT